MTQYDSMVQIETLALPTTQDRYDLLDTAYFGRGWEIDQLVLPLMQEYGDDRSTARMWVMRWARKRGYTITSVDVVALDL